jgi:hypothetical protein
MFIFIFRNFLKNKKLIRLGGIFLLTLYKIQNILYIEYIF